MFERYRAWGQKVREAGQRVGRHKLKDEEGRYLRPNGDGRVHASSGISPVSMAASQAVQGYGSHRETRNQETHDEDTGYRGTDVKVFFQSVDLIGKVQEHSAREQAQDVLRYGFAHCHDLSQG